MRKCIYCNQDKDESEFSLEHIFPTSLGGKVASDDVFKTRSVCKECNNKLGLYVDGSFLKSFFIQNQKAMNYLNYIDFNNDKYTLPFIFVGKKRKIKHDDYKFCDIWLWQGGSKVYHFHNNYTEPFDTYSGGNPIAIKDKKRAGEAYLISSTDNLLWIKKLLLSFKEYFGKTKRYAVNLSIQNENDILFNPSDKEQAIIDKIYNLGEDGLIKTRIAINIYFEIRFLSKLSLALGHSLFGNSYLNTSYAQILNKTIWEKDNKQIENNKLKILNFFHSPDISNSFPSEILAFKGGHTIILSIIYNKLVLVLYLSGNIKPHIMEITDQLNTFGKNNILEKYPNGLVWVLVQPLNIFSGPFGLPEYLAYQSGDKNFITDLVDIENSYIPFEDLPPFILNKTNLKKSLQNNTDEDLEF